MVGSLLGSPLLVSCCSLSGNGNGSALSKTTTNTDGFPTLPTNVTNTDGFPTLPKTLSLRTSTGNNVRTPLTRNNFPEDFIFGSASSAYQIEGAWNEDGKGPSIWDTFTHQQPEKIQDRSNGNVAIDSYHRYKEDIDIMKHIGLDAYRFSIAWTRILPRGNLNGGVNQAGIKHYSDLIDYMLSKGLKPFATIFHWDVPQHLEDEYGGFLSPKIIEDYKDFANICFREFGDRVKHWITVNEPQTFAVFGYATGVHAPGRCSPNVGNCRAGDSGTEPYQVGHHLLLAHATAVKLYREEYQSYQDGTIGLSLATPWVVPLSETMSDHHAAQRSIDFSLGWYMEPLTSGNYPLSMISRVRERLPKFTREESELVKGSYDFIGVNYYTGNYATDIPPINNIPPNYMTDSHAYLLMKRNGKPIGDQAVSSWLYTFSQGIRDLTVYIKERYNNPTMYITENGMDQAFSQSSLEESLRDNMRVYYYYHHLAWLLEALERDNVDVRGHFAWSIFDNFEWSNGYQIRFGINYVDYENNLKRFAKNSAIWFQNFLNGYKEFETVERTNYNRLLKATIGH